MLCARNIHDKVRVYGKYTIKFTLFFVFLIPEGGWNSAPKLWCVLNGAISSKIVVYDVGNWLFDGDVQNFDNHRLVRSQIHCTSSFCFYSTRIMLLMCSKCRWSFKLRLYCHFFIWTTSIQSLVVIILYNYESTSIKSRSLITKTVLNVSIRYFTYWIHDISPILFTTDLSQISFLYS